MDAILVVVDGTSRLDLTGDFDKTVFVDSLSKFETDEACTLDAAAGDSSFCPNKVVVAVSVAVVVVAAVGVPLVVSDG